MNGLQGVIDPWGGLTNPFCFLALPSGWFVAAFVPTSFGSFGLFERRSRRMFGAKNFLKFLFWNRGLNTYVVNNSSTSE